MTVLKTISLSLLLVSGSLSAALPTPTADQKAALESVSGKKVRVCIFDPVGANGPAVGYAKDYMLEARKWGINADVVAFTDERVAAEELKAGQCDAAAITTLRTKQFNHFVGSLDAVGGIPDKKHMNMVLQTLASPRMAPLMRSGLFEVVGVIPLGGAYVMVRDRRINSIEAAAGKKVAVMEWDRSQAKMVQRLGAQPVASDITNFVGKFNNGQVDIIAAPAVAYKPLEIYRGLGNDGGIYRFPLVMLSAALIIRHDRFPPDVGQKLREFVVTQIGKAYEFVDREEAAIPAKYWIDLPPQEKIKYEGMMREARIQMTHEGDYDKRMMSLLKRVRCTNKPTAAECTSQEE